MNKTEKLARELDKLRRTETTETLAKHVESMVLEARIDTLKKYSGAGNSICIDIEIELCDLIQQLNSLNALKEEKI